MKWKKVIAVGMLNVMFANIMPVFNVSAYAEEYYTLKAEKEEIKERLSECENAN